MRAIIGLVVVLVIIGWLVDPPKTPVVAVVDRPLTAQEEKRWCDEMAILHYKNASTPGALERNVCLKFRY